MAVIEVEGLTKAYGETLANDHLDFSIERGEIFGYLGPNGAGKSTTIRQLLGFQSPTEGTATIFGVDVRDARASRDVRSRIGFIPGEPAFSGSITGEEFLDYQAALKGDSRRGELLESFTPPLSRKIREYSSGNKQMLAIVQAFMHDPDLVVMDEPTSGLDPLKQGAFNEFLRAERDRGTTVFFSSHVLGEVRRVCDRIGIIRDGRLVTVEAVEELLDRSGKRVRVSTDDRIDRDDLDLPGIVDVESHGREVQFTFTGDYNELFAELRRHSLVDVEIDEPPIEEVFMHFYGDPADA
jgi:ABC-2 type transport system ATP-binding protein